MRIINEQNSATLVTINLKVSMSRDIIANSKITKAYYVVNPCDSCKTDVNTPLNAIHVHYMNVYMYVNSTYIVSMRHIINRLRNDRRLVNDVITSTAHVQTLSNYKEPGAKLAENREMCCIATSN